MENLKVTLKQVYTNNQGIELNNELNLNIEQINSDVKDTEIVGTILNEIFEYLELQKQVGSKAIKLNRPIILEIKGAGIKSIDFGVLDIHIVQRLKAGNKAKAKRLFAQKIVASLNYIVRERKLKDITELFAELDNKIAIESAK
jgi:hypothetical protein